MFYRFKYHQAMGQLTQGQMPPTEILNFCCRMGQVNDWKPVWAAIVTVATLMLASEQMEEEAMTGELQKFTPEPDLALTQARATLRCWQQAKA